MTISIKTDDDGRVTNRYIGEKGADWIQTNESDWPTPELVDNEIPQFYYNDGKISVETKVVNVDEW